MLLIWKIVNTVVVIIIEVNIIFVMLSNSLKSKRNIIWLTSSINLPLLEVSLDFDSHFSCFLTTADPLLGDDSLALCGGAC